MNERRASIAGPPLASHPKASSLSWRVLMIVLSDGFGAVFPDSAAEACRSSSPSRRTSGQPMSHPAWICAAAHRIAFKPGPAKGGLGPSSTIMTPSFLCATPCRLSGHSSDAWIISQRFSWCPKSGTPSSQTPLYWMAASIVFSVASNTKTLALRGTESRFRAFGSVEGVSRHQRGGAFRRQWTEGITPPSAT